MPEAINAGAVGIKIEANSDDFEKDIKKSSNDAAKTIENTLNDTAKSAKSKAATIAAVYKKQGYSQSEAMKKAWSQIERSSAISTARVTDNINDITAQAQLTSAKVTGSFKEIGIFLASAFSTAAIVSFGKECTELGSDLSEVQNVVDVTFTSMNEKLNEWAGSAIDTFGISETMAKKYAGLYGSMASAFGFAESEAYDMATTLAGLSGDVASFYNISQDEAYTKLKAVFSGETEALKDLGIVMTQSALDAYALSNGFSKTVQQMTEAEKVSLRYNFVLDQLSNAQGDFLRTQDSWANQTRILQLRFDSLKATIGQGLITALTPAIKYLNTMIDRMQVLADAFSNMMSKLFGVSDSTANAISSTVAAEQLLTDSADESASAVDGVTNSIKKSSDAAKGSVASFDKLNVLTTSTSSASSAGAGTSGSAGSVSNALNSNVVQSAESLDSEFSALFENFYEKSGFKDFVDEIQKGINSVDWGSIEDNCESILKSSQPIANAIITNSTETGKSALKTFGTYAGGIVSVTGKSVQTVSGGIADWLERDNEKIVDFIEDVNTSCQDGFGNLSTFFDKWFGLIGSSIDRMRPRTESTISNLLSSMTSYATSIGTVIADSFEISTNSLVKWIDKDGEEISTFFDNIQGSANDTVAVFDTAFSDMGDIISEWWNGENGASTFADVCDMFTDIGTTFMNVWDEWIEPCLDFFTITVRDAWNSSLKPVFDNLLSVFGKLGECISTVWNNFLSPVVDWIVETMAPIIENKLNAIKRVFETVFEYIGGIISSALMSLGGLLDFVTGVFSNDWEKAWGGIKDYFGGIWSGVVVTLRNAVNLIIDGLNLVWTNLYIGLKYIINDIGETVAKAGDILGKDWGFSVPDEAPLIPRWEPDVKLAKGGLVKAPTLAVVGDNPGASNGDPEVVAPLSKLQSMINTSSGQDVVILTQILDYLKRIYEMFVVFRNNGGNMIQFIAKLNGDVLFEEMVRQHELYKKRHNGESAF